MLRVGIGFFIDVRDVFDVFGVSVSVSLPEEASSSQLSATGLDLAFTADSGDVLVEMVRWERVCATSEGDVSIFWKSALRVFLSYLLGREFCETC